MMSLPRCAAVRSVYNCNVFSRWPGAHFIDCGTALGVKSLAVATGTHAAGQLAAHGPDYLFHDLSDWRAAYEAILA